MINATFATVSKRVNSTLIPSLSGGEIITISLKDPCSVIDPRILLKHTNPTSYNYVYIPAFNRYYFINDWTSDHGMWEAKCHVDVLSTYRATIRNSTQYVLRSYSTYDLNIQDDYYPTDCVKDHFRLAGKDSPSGSDYFPFNGAYSYIIGCVGIPSDTPIQANYYNGSVTYYWVTPGQMLDIINYLMSTNAITDIFGNITDISMELQKGLLNPLQYITSVIKVPVECTTPTGYEDDATSTIRFGWADISVATIGCGSVHLCDINSTFDFNIYFNLSHALHPQNPRGNYLNVEPYTRMQIEFEPFGSFGIDTSKIETAVMLKIEISIEKIRGIGILKLYPVIANTVEGQTTYDVQYQNLIYYTQAQIGNPVTLSQINRDHLGTVGGIVDGVLGIGASVAGGVASGMMGNPFGVVQSAISGVAQVAGAIGNTIKTQTPQSNTKGTNGSPLAFIIPGPYLHITHYHLVGEDLEDMGRPLCRKVQLSDLNGFTLCQNADLSISGTQNECDAIKGYLNTGVFLE